MSRFYDAMRRAAENEAPPKPDAERKKPTSLKEIAGASRDLEEDFGIEELAEDTVEETPEPYSIPDVDILDPVPIRPSVQPAGNQAQAIRSSQTTHPSYERVIQRLFAFRGGRRHCVILVASAVSGEGASTVCRNLADAVVRNHGGKVVLVDANMRNPSQGDPEAEGLSELLNDEVKLKEVLQEDPESGLAVLGSGSSSESPQHVLTLPRLQRVVTSLHSEFDWVFLYGPPVTIYPDASNLAVVADGAILVVRAEVTRWEVAEEAKKILNQSGVSLLGGVLNRRKYHIPKFIYKRL